MKTIRKNITASNDQSAWKPIEDLLNLQVDLASACMRNDVGLQTKMGIDAQGSFLTYEVLSNPTNSVTFSGVVRNKSDRHFHTVVAMVEGKVVSSLCPPAKEFHTMESGQQVPISYWKRWLKIENDITNGMPADDKQLCLGSIQYACWVGYDAKGNQLLTVRDYEFNKDFEKIDSLHLIEHENDGPIVVISFKGEGAASGRDASLGQTLNMTQAFDKMTESPVIPSMHGRFADSIGEVPKANISTLPKVLTRAEYEQASAEEKQAYLSQVDWIQLSMQSLIDRHPTMELVPAIQEFLIEVLHSQIFMAEWKEYVQKYEDGAFVHTLLYYTARKLGFSYQMLNAVIGPREPHFVKGNLDVSGKVQPNIDKIVEEIESGTMKVLSKDELLPLPHVEMSDYIGKVHQVATAIHAEFFSNGPVVPEAAKAFLKEALSSDLYDSEWQIYQKSNKPKRFFSRGPYTAAFMGFSDMFIEKLFGNSSPEKVDDETEQLPIGQGADNASFEKPTSAKATSTTTRLKSPAPKKQATRISAPGSKTQPTRIKKTTTKKL